MKLRRRRLGQDGGQRRSGEGEAGRQRGQVWLEDHEMRILPEVGR